MCNNELKKFCEMVLLYDQVGNVLASEMAHIETVKKLYDSSKFDAVDAIFNENEEFETADEMMENYFGHNTESLNKLADEFGYQRVA